MSRIIYDNPSVFLIITGGAYADDITAAHAPDALRSGLCFRHQAPHGAIDIAIAAPADLAAFADLAAAAILKPVCLPIALESLRHGTINARLHSDPTAHRLAQRFLTAMGAVSHPAHQRRCLHHHTANCPHNNMKEK